MEEEKRENIMTTQEKIDSKNRLPELNAIDNSINHYARALLTEIPALRKVWHKGAHLHYKSGFDNKYIYCSNSPLFEKAMEQQQIDEDIRMASTIINFNSKENYAVVFPNVQSYWDRLDYRVYIRMDKNKEVYWISRDNMETWEKKNVRKFDMRQHKNGQTSELDCFINVSLTALCFEKIKNDKSLKSKGGKQGLKVHIRFENSNGNKEEIKTALDVFKIIKGHTNYQFKLRKFHNDLKANCAGGKEWRLLSKNGLFSVCLSLPCINYKNISIIKYKDLNSGLNLETKELQFIVNAQVQKGKQSISELNPEEKWPENYQAFQKPRKTGTNSEKYLNIIENIDNDDVVLDDDMIKEIFSSEDKEDITGEKEPKYIHVVTTEPVSENPKYIHVVTTTDTSYDASTLKEYEIYAKSCPEGYAFSIKEWHGYRKE